MQVFKAFYRSILKHYKPILIYTFVFVIIQLILVNNVSKQSYGNFTSTKVKIAVFDHDNTAESKALYDYLDETQNIISIKEDKESMADELFNRNVNYILTIPEGFSKDNTILENVKQPDSTSGYIIDNDINQFLQTYHAYSESGYSASDTLRLTKESMNQTANVTVISKNNSSSGKSLISYFFQYMPYILLTLFIVSIGSILCIFRQKDLSARIQCSSLSITKRNLQMALGCVTFGLILVLVLTVLSGILYPADFFRINTLLCIANAIMSMLLSLSLTLFISYFVHSDNALNLIANLAGLALCFLGGVFVPLDVLSSSVKNAAKFLPTYWYVLANDIASAFDGSQAQLNTFFHYLGIQLLFIIVIFAITLVTSKIRKTA